MKPKILIFIDWYKPGFKAGGPIKSVSNLVAHLADAYDFFIVTRNTDYLEKTPYKNLEYNSWVEVDQSKVCYLDRVHQNKSAIKKLIQEVNPSIIYCNSLYSPKFTITPIRIANKLNIPIRLAVRGMLSEGSLNVKSHKKRIFLSLVKSVKLFKNVIFHATSSQEMKNIRAQFGKDSEVVCASNLPAKRTSEFTTKEKLKGELKVLYLGRISPEKNTLFAIEQLNACEESITFDIYGPIYNKEYFQTCHETANQLPNNIVVNFKGSLNPIEISNIMPAYHVIYLPSTGENYGHSIVEGMQYGCVPVISDRTPWKNLLAQKIGYDIPLENPKAFSKALDDLALMDATGLNQLSLNAFNYAKEIANNHEAIQEYNKLFQLRN